MICTLVTPCCVHAFLITRVNPRGYGWCFGQCAIVLAKHGKCGLSGCVAVMYGSERLLAPVKNGLASVS